jgi:MFS family permease
VLTRTLLACYAMSGAIHLASISLNTLLPFHVVALGGRRTQVGLLFSAATVVSMLLRPAVGGWVDRFGARRVILPDIAVQAAGLRRRGAHHAEVGRRNLVCPDSKWC